MGSSAAWWSPWSSSPLWRLTLQQFKISWHTKHIEKTVVRINSTVSEHVWKSKMDQTVRVKFLHVNKMLWRGQRGEKSKTLVQFPYKMLFVSLARRLSSAMNRCTFIDVLCDFRLFHPKLCWREMPSFLLETSICCLCRLLLIFGPCLQHKKMHVS